MRHAQRIQHGKDRIHTRMVLGAVGLRRERCGERFLAASAPRHLALIDRRLDGRLCLQRNILVRDPGIVQLASAERLGARISCFEVRMFHRHALGGRVVVDSVASVAFLLLF